MSIAVVIVAAGRGVRAAGAGSEPKQYVELAGRPVLDHTIEAFDRAGIASIQVVIHPEDAGRYRALVDTGRAGLRAPVHGGSTRQSSVLAGLEALEGSGVEQVLIHDAARPFVSPDAIERVIAALSSHPAALSAVPLTDTVKRMGADGIVTATLDRNHLWRAQTPQGFHFRSILDAHRRAAVAGLSHFTDDAEVAEWAGLSVAVVTGDSANFKLTTAEDIAMAQRLTAKPPAPDVRTGSGYDVHRFAPGDGVWLCGVLVPHLCRLDGHSDADVGLHALTDALLGAIADGDIGQHFPPSDPKWKGAASRLFLEDAARRVAARGGRIGNVDVTLVCEAPRIAPHRDAMRASIAGILGIDKGRVAVKATTSEGLGFTGRREGIAAMATASVVLGE